MLGTLLTLLTIRQHVTDAHWNQLEDPWGGHQVHGPKFPLYQQEGEAQRGAVISSQTQSSAKCPSSAQIRPPSLP